MPKSEKYRASILVKCLSRLSNIKQRHGFILLKENSFNAEGVSVFSKIKKKALQILEGSDPPRIESTDTEHLKKLFRNKILVEDCLSEEELKLLCRNVCFRRLKPNSPIFLQGEQALEYFFLLDGVVKFFTKYRLYNEGAVISRSLLQERAGDDLEQCLGRPRKIIQAVGAFGEWEILTGCKRLCSAVAVGLVKLAVVNKEHFQLIFLAKQRERFGVDRKTEMLHCVSALSSWNPSQMNVAAYYLKEVRIPEKGVVASAGDKLEHVFFLYSGTVAISEKISKSKGAKKSSYKQGTEDLKVCMACQGTILGDIEAIKGSQEFMYNYTATEDTVVFRIPIKFFTALFLEGRFGDGKAVMDALQASAEVRLSYFTNKVKETISTKLQTKKDPPAMDGFLREALRQSMSSDLDSGTNPRSPQNSEIPKPALSSCRSSAKKFFAAEFEDVELHKEAKQAGCGKISQPKIYAPASNRSSNFFTPYKGKNTQQKGYQGTSIYAQCSDESSKVLLKQMRENPEQAALDLSSCLNQPSIAEGTDALVVASSRRRDRVASGLTPLTSRSKSNPDFNKGALSEAMKDSKPFNFDESSPTPPSPATNRQRKTLVRAAKTEIIQSRTDMLIENSKLQDDPLSYGLADFRPPCTAKSKLHTGTIDAEINGAIRRGRSDPELASLETSPATSPMDVDASAQSSMTRQKRSSLQQKSPIPLKIITGSSPKYSSNAAGSRSFSPVPSSPASAFSDSESSPNHRALPRHKAVSSKKPGGFSPKQAADTPSREFFEGEDMAIQGETVQRTRSMPKKAVPREHTFAEKEENFQQGETVQKTRSSFKKPASRENSFPDKDDTPTHVETVQKTRSSFKKSASRENSFPDKDDTPTHAESTQRTRLTRRSTGHASKQPLETAAKENVEKEDVCSQEAGGQRPRSLTRKSTGHAPKPAQETTAKDNTEKGETSVQDSRLARLKSAPQILKTTTVKSRDIPSDSLSTKGRPRSATQYVGATSKHPLTHTDTLPSTRTTGEEQHKSIWNRKSSSMDDSKDGMEGHARVFPTDQAQKSSRYPAAENSLAIKGDEQSKSTLGRKTSSMDDSKDGLEGQPRAYPSGQTQKSSRYAAAENPLIIKGLVQRSPTHFPQQVNGKGKPKLALDEVQSYDFRQKNDQYNCESPAAASCRSLPVHFLDSREGTPKPVGFNKFDEHERSRSGSLFSIPPVLMVKVKPAATNA